MPASAVTPAGPFHLRCLGPVTLTGPEGQRLRLRTRKHYALLYLLARRAGVGVSRDELIELLWSEDDGAKARHSLSQSISLINKVMGRDVIGAVQKNQLAVSRDVVWLDVAEFERAVDEGRSEDAQALWRGPVLDGEWVSRAPNFERWLTGERDRLIRLLRSALRGLMDAHRGAGDWPAMGRVADALLEADPLDEGSMLASLEALTLGGERTAALRRYGEFEARLREELDAEPGTALKAWHRRHRKGDGGRAAPVKYVATHVSDQHALPAVRPVYGREDEYGLLWECWEKTQRTGQGVFLIMEGVAGIGKSALAGKLLNQLHVSGASVCLARCYRTEKAVPFAPVSAIIRQLSRQPGFVALGDVWIGELTRLVPELKQRFPNAPPPLAIDESARHRLSDGVLEACQCVADEHPLLIVVDDIHDADEASLALLHYLGRSVAEQPIFLICITRSGAPLSEFERTFFDTARAAGLARFMTLERLPDHHVERIARQVFAERGIEAPDEAVERVREVADGNPLHAIEAALAAHAQDASLAHNRSTASPTRTSAEVPSFSDTAGLRLETLPTHCRALVHLLAVASRPVAESDIAAAMQLGPADLASACQALEQTHYVRRSGSSIGLAHEQYATRFERDLDEPSRAGLHAKLARVFRDSAAANPAARYEVAVHFAEAGLVDEARSEALAAARYARLLGAVREQASAIKLALRVLTRPDPRLVVDLGTCLLELREFDELKVLCDQSTVSATSEVARDLSYFGIAADYHAGRDRLLSIRARLEALLEDGAPFKNRSAATIALIRLADRTGDHLLARRIARAFRRQDRTQVVGGLSAHALHSTAFMRAKYYRPQSALNLLRLALEQAQRTNDWDLEHLCRSGLGAVLRQLGRFADSIAELERGLALARRTPNPQAEAASLMDIANAEIPLGNYRRAVALMAAASAIDEKYPRWMIRCYRYLNTGELNLITGDLEASRYNYETAYELSRSIDLWPVIVFASAGLAMCAQRIVDLNELDRWVRVLESIAQDRLSVPHDRWTAEAAVAWHVAMIAGSPPTALARLDAASRDLQRRDIDHWLRIQLESVRMRLHAGLSLEPNQVENLISRATDCGASGVLAEVVQLRRHSSTFR